MGVFEKLNSTQSSESGGIFKRLKAADGPNMHEKVAIGKVPSMNIASSPLAKEAQDQYQSAASLQGQKPRLPGRDIPVIGHALKALDWVASNPVSESIAEHTVPDAPYLNDPSGTNARDAFLQRSGQQPATGVSKFIGAASAPFFVPGAGLGTGNAATEASRSALQKVAPKLTGVGQTVARESLTGGIIGAGSEFAQGDGDMKQAAVSGAFGAAGGAALPLAGKAIQNTKFGQAITDFFSRPAAATPSAEQPFTEMLALPSPREGVKYNRSVSGNQSPTRADKSLYNQRDNITRQRDEVYQQHNDYLNSLRQKYAAELQKNGTESLTGVLTHEELKVSNVYFQKGLDLSKQEKVAQQAILDAERKLNTKQPYLNKLPYGETPVAPATGIPANALPQGNYIQPQRLRVNDPTEVLNSVMQRIKPEVEQTIAVPQRRDLLIQYIQKHTDIPVKEIHNMPMGTLQSLGQDVRQGIDIPNIAYEAAKKHGYDLQALLEGKAPNITNRVSRDASARVAGVYPESLPNLQQPEGFNISARGQAEAPVLKTGFRTTGSAQRSQVARNPIVEHKPIDITPSRVVERTISQPVVQQRGFTETLLASEKTPQGLKSRLKSAYTPVTNEMSVAHANKRVVKDLESAASYVMGKSPTSAEKVTTAHRLIDEFSKQNNFERANDIADKIASELTKAGQSIQAASIYNRLTPEGILVHANRVVQRVNESLPITAKEVKVTPEMSANIMDLAQTTQKMTGVKDLANDVMNILDKAKSGATLSETEAATLRNFVNESKQFVKETTSKPRAPRVPKQPQDKRVMDNVVSYLDAQEQAAKERLRARGIQISSTPLDVWADYAVIGAAKMAKGTIKFAEWSEQMIKEFGESIRPQLQHLYEHSVQAFEQSSKTISKQTISEAERLTEKVIKGKQLEQGASDSLRSLAKKVSGLSGEEKRLASQDLQSILQSLERPGRLKQVSSLQTIGQLLNPKTQVRNALGNELFYRVERLNKMLATPIDIVRSKVTGGERTVTFRTNNQGQYWKNWIHGGKAGWKQVNVNGLETQYDLASPAFKGKYNPLTYMEKSLGAALRSFDTAAYMRAYNDTVGELATLRAINEGKRGDKELIQKYIREADDNVMKIADEYGRYVTFQDNNIISNGLVALKKGLNFKKDFGLGDLVLKYPKTPGAILMRALEYSPAGFLRSSAILARPWYKKEPNTAEATQALSRAMIGTFGLTGLGYFLMDNGVVTGAASKDKDVRDLQKSAGQGQYQVNFSALKRLVESGFDSTAAKLEEGDLLYTYDWMQPISMAISMGANISKNMSEGKQKLSGLAGTAYNSFEGGIGTLTEQSVLQGLKSAAQGYPGQTITDKITDILSDVPASFIPTYSNQIKQLTDNASRETYSPNKLEQSMNKAKARIPGVAGDLPQRYDTLGKPRETYQDNNAFNVLFNPGFSSRYELSPEAKMVINLINETDDETLAPRVPSKSINVDGVSVKLTGDQFTRYQQIQGEETQKAIIKRYKPDASLKNRSKTMNDILYDSGVKARDQLKKEIK